MISESTIYRLIDYNAFTARNIDLPRKVRFSKRKAKKQLKLDKDCRNGRTYKDYLEFIAQNPSLPVTQMDSVEEKKGGQSPSYTSFRKSRVHDRFPEGCKRCAIRH